MNQLLPGALRSLARKVPHSTNPLLPESVPSSPIWSSSCLAWGPVMMSPKEVTFRGTWIAELVRHLPSTQVMIPGSWDWTPHWDPCSSGNLLLPLLVLSLSLCQINKYTLFFFKLLSWGNPNLKFPPLLAITNLPMGPVVILQGNHVLGEKKLSDHLRRIGHLLWGTQGFTTILWNQKEVVHPSQPADILHISTLARNG